MKKVFIFDCFGVLIDEGTFLPIQNGVLLLEHAKKCSDAVLMLTNATQGRMEQLKKTYPDIFGNMVDIVTTTETGFLKPSSEHFVYLLDKHHLNAQDCIFIDDAHANIQAACELGMQVILFDTYGDDGLDHYKEKIKERIDGCKS